MATVRGLKKRALRVKARAMPEHSVALADGSSIRVDLRDEGGLQLAVWGSGRLQPLAIHAWHRLLAARRWDLIVDVGANYGEFAVPASRAHADTVIAIEPNPRVNALLAESIRRAGGIATVCTAFLSDKAHVAALVSDGNSRTGRMARRGSVTHTSSDVDLFVPALPLDAVVGEGTAGGSALIKIDVEGAESNVLSGASALLGTSAPIALLVETLHADVRTIAGSVSGFETWGFDAQTGEPHLVHPDQAIPGGVSLRDILLTRDLDVLDVFSTHGHTTT